MTVTQYQTRVLKVMKMARRDALAEVARSRRLLGMAAGGTLSNLTLVNRITDELRAIPTGNLKKEKRKT